MDAILHEWGGLLIRWVHMITGMCWIGASFYFMHIDASLKRIPEIPKGGEAWEVHGGGFYQVRKWLVAPERLPPDLIWHKWQSYSTWISGFFLLVWVYYFSADLYLIDPEIREIPPIAAIAIGIGSLVLGWVVYDALCKSPLARNEVALAGVGFAFLVVMAWLFQQVFSGRGALIHIGALMATIMSGNVAMNIIPNQRKVIADLVAGREPNPEFGRQAKARSSHNNYMTLPVLFLMISGHYPLTYSTPHTWIIVALVLVAGGVVRHFYNERHAGRGDPWWTWIAAAVCVGVAIVISMLGSPTGRAKLGLTELPVPRASAATLPKEVDEIVSSRCAMCHAREPVWAGIAMPPKGIVLDTPRDVLRAAHEIRVQAVLTRAMPPNNITQMTQDERRVLAAWLERR
ncbi:MAG: urate hydroxylase PuuD [Alphaproteobacteria bacterium]|nr:urate hydroxylase PuuD [Alphaproteobacteria bacterium]